MMGIATKAPLDPELPTSKLGNQGKYVNGPVWVEKFVWQFGEA
jgi:hypothetical protein